MAVDLPKVHEQALQHTGQYVAGVKDDQWGAATPDDEWDVRALVNHIVSGNFWVAPLVEGKTIEEVGDRYDGDVLGSDASASYEQSAKEAAAAFNADGAMQAPCAVSYGPVPGAIYAGHRFVDVLIHGWDLAKATGQDTTLPADLVEACFEVVEPQKELLSASGMFGSEVKVPDGADHQTRLLAELGRKA
ncbi:MAG: TIGR03086 family protein [Acidimicrobiia bacterium]|nr:TIGR03086 family protein [Acidimicrobiia bacterium]MBV9042778.1 TIGR03086 family protein [Acidimicrobiia bacterium]